MLSKKNFPNRVNEARALAKFAKIVRDTGKAFEVILPGHEAKEYRVILKWAKTGKDYVMTAECGLNTSRGHINCKGNSMNVCYHVMAAVIAVANSHKAKVSFATDENDAMRLVNMKNNANRLVSRQSLEYIWIVS